MPSEFTNRLLAEYAAKRAAVQGQQTNEQLGQSIQNNLAEVGAGPSVLDRGMNILGRGFDLLSRPLYGVAEGVRDVVTGEDNPLSGVIQGLEGKKKTTFSTVLGEMGVQGPLRGILGFGLDVALDPTTYLTGGIVRGASEAAAETAAGKVGAKAAARLATTTEEGASKLAAALRKEFTQQTIEAGEKITGSEFRAARREFVRRGIDDASIEEARKAMDSALAKNAQKAAKGKVELRVAGTPVASSEKLYSAGSRVAKTVGNTTVGDAFGRAFRTTKLFSRELNPIKRRLDGLGLASAEKFANVVRHGGQFEELTLPAFGHLTEEEANLITHAIDTNTTMQELSTRGIPLEEYRQAAKSIFEKLGYAEAELGIHDISQLADNYVPFRANVKKSDSTLVNQIKNGRRNEGRLQAAFVNAAESPEPWIFQGEHSLQGIIQQLGEDGVITDIRRLIGDRIGESYRDIGRHTWNLAAAREFGVDLGKGKERLASKLGLQKVGNKVMGDLVKAGRVTEGTYFPKEIAAALRNSDKAFFDDVSSQGLVRLYDKALQTLKFGQTAVNPGHHIRNALTDITLNFMDGVVNPRVYDSAARIMRAQGKLDAGLEEELLGKTLPTLQIGKMKQPLNASQLWNEFTRVGGKSGFFRSEITKSNFGPIEWIRRRSEQREDWARFAHFLDAFEKEGKNARNISDLSKAAERAGERVRKFNIDYGDLTSFEQRTMKRVVPFYTWMRKNVPLQIENMFLRPGRMTIAPKLHRDIEAALGTDDTFDVAGLNVLPSWMRDAMYTTLVGEGQGRNGTYWNPAAAFPQMDLANFFGHGPSDMIENQLAGLTPALRVPIEAVTNHNFYSGNDSNSPLYSQAGGQVPLIRLAIGSHENLGTKLLNWATGLGISNPTDANIRGELRSQQDIVQELLRRYYEAHPEITRSQRQDQVALQQFLQRSNQ